MKEAISTTNAPTPLGPYSQAIRAGGFIFVAGQAPVDPATGEVVGPDIADQTRRTLDNVKAILEAGGATMADVVKTTVHLADMADFKAFNEVYATYFPDPKPVRTTVGSALPNIKVEIDVIAEEGKG